MLDELEIHVRSMVFKDSYSIALKRHDLLSERICKVYSRYIPCVFYVYTMRRSLASSLSCPSALGSLRPGLPLELLSFGHREAAHARLGPSKVPQHYYKKQGTNYSRNKNNEELDRTELKIKINSLALELYKEKAINKPLVKKMAKLYC
jgi:hypothetical protein